MQALRKDNVKVVLINPGPIATALTEVNMADQKCISISVHTRRKSAYMHQHTASTESQQSMLDKSQA